MWARKRIRIVMITKTLIIVVMITMIMTIVITRQQW
jgi:hypothetical protein